MKHLVTPDVTIAVYADGDWLLRAKHTGYIQLSKSQIKCLVDRTGITVRNRGQFPARPEGWSLMVETVDGPVLRTFATRREYREAKRGL